MTQFLRLLVMLITALGINAVPIAGILGFGWSVGTGMLLYLGENLMAILLLALRIRLLTPGYESIPGRKPQTRKGVLEGFLVTSLGFSAGAAIFMVAFIFLFLRTPLEPVALGLGLAVIFGFELFSFLSDLLMSGRISLAETDALIKPALGRVFLLYLAVFMGVFVAMLKSEWFFWPFIVLKTLADIGPPLEKIFRRVKQMITGIPETQHQDTA